MQQVSPMEPNFDAANAQPLANEPPRAELWDVKPSSGGPAPRGPPEGPRPRGLSPKVAVLALGAVMVVGGIGAFLALGTLTPVHSSTGSSGGSTRTSCQGVSCTSPGNTTAAPAPAWAHALEGYGG